MADLDGVGSSVEFDGLPDYLDFRIPTDFVDEVLHLDEEHSILVAVGVAVSELRGVSDSTMSEHTQSRFGLKNRRSRNTLKDVQAEGNHHVGDVRDV